MGASCDHVKFAIIPKKRNAVRIPFCARMPSHLFPSLQYTCVCMCWPPLVSCLLHCNGALLLYVLLKRAIILYLVYCCSWVKKENEAKDFSFGQLSQLSQLSQQQIQERLLPKQTTPDTRTLGGQRGSTLFSLKGVGWGVPRLPSIARANLLRRRKSKKRTGYPVRTLISI